MSFHWILENNLQLFLTMAARLIGYAIDDSDLDAVRFGIEGTDVWANIWYDYPLVGTPPIHFRFSRPEVVSWLAVRWETEKEIDARIESLVRILQRYEPHKDTTALEELIAEAFSGTPHPDGGSILGCTPEHLAMCEECQGVKEIFEGKHWSDLVKAGSKPLPRSSYGPSFLREEAQVFFFPAYLIAALRGNDSELLFEPFSRVKKVQFSGLRRDLIEFAEFVIG